MPSFNRISVLLFRGGTTLNYLYRYIMWKYRSVTEWEKKETKCILRILSVYIYDYELGCYRNKDEYDEIEQSCGCKCCPLTSYSIYPDLMSYQYDLTLLGCSTYISVDIYPYVLVPCSVRVYVQLKCVH